MDRYAVIIAGGAGERFWPLSRIAKPKHLWNIAGGRDCLLEQTLQRVGKIVRPDRIVIITNSEQVDGICASCPNVSKEMIIAEPIGRDTTAAIGLAAILIRRKSPEASFAVFPSDHVIENVSGFSDTLECAFALAESGDNLVTIGIPAAAPSTAFGYIKRGEKKDTELGEIFKVDRFFEKPSYDRAVSYVESGKFYWNAGVFVWKADTILKAIKSAVPAIYASLEKISSALDANVPLGETLKENYPEIEKISIDFSVMERANNAWVVPARFDWDDVGSWSAIERHYPKDASSNVSVGELFSAQSQDCVVFDAAGRATVLLGVKDIIVVHAKDATLVCRKDCAERLKDLVRTLPPKYR